MMWNDIKNVDNLQEREKKRRERAQQLTMKHKLLLWYLIAIKMEHGDIFGCVKVKKMIAILF